MFQQLGLGAWVLRVLHTAHIYYENNGLHAACSVENGEGEVLPFPIDDAKMFLS